MSHLVVVAPEPDVVLAVLGRNFAYPVEPMSVGAARLLTQHPGLRELVITGCTAAEAGSWIAGMPEGAGRIAVTCCELTEVLPRVARLTAGGPDQLAALLADAGQLLSGHGGLGFFSIDEVDGSAVLSAAWLRILGYSAGGLEQTASAFFGLLHPEDADNLRTAASFGRSEGAHTFQTQFRMRHRDGSWRWMNSTGVALIGPEDRVLRITGFNIDITELRHSQRLYRDLIENFPGGLMSVVAPNLRVLLTGGDGWSMAGMNTELLPGRNVLEAARPERRASLERFWGAVFSGRSAYDEALAENGAIFAFRGTPLRDETGQIYAGLCVGVNITDERRTISRLADSERRYRLATAAGRVGCWEAEPESRILYFDTISASLHGFRAGEPVPVAEFLARIDPDGNPDVGARLISALDGSTAEFTAEFRVIGPDGPARWVEFRARGIRDEDGVLVRLTGTSMDITERREAVERLHESEARLRGTLSELPVAVAMFDEKLRLTFANRLVRELARHADAGWLLDPCTPEGLFSRLDTGEPLGPGNHPAAEALKTRSPVRGVTIFRPGGASAGMWLRVDAIPEGSGTRHPDVVMTVVDLTERFTVEAEIRQSLNEKELLLKEVYHRVKNNLQVVSTLVSMEARQSGRKSADEALRDVGARVAAMSLVHEQLYRTRDLSKIEFEGYARTLCQNLLRSLAAKGSQVRLEVSSDRIRLSLGAAIPLGLILNELVSNSLKHAFPAGRSGHLHVRLQQSDGAMATLTVEDDGIATAAPSMDGGTLGLRIVDTLASQVRGSARWEPRPGGGLRAVVLFRTDAGERSSN